MTQIKLVTHKTYLYVLGLVLMQCIVFHQWVFANSIFTFGDIGIYTIITQQFLFEQVQNIYNAHSDFGSINITASNYPFLLLFGLLGKIGINFIWSSKIMLFWPIVFGVVLNSFFFFRYITKNETAAFIGALFYSYGIYFLITLTGALYLSFAYAFAPLILLLFFKNIHTPNIKNALIFGLSSGLYGFIEFRILYVLMWVCLLYFLYFLFTEKISKKKLISHIITNGISLIVLIGLHLFWILPVALQGKISNNELFNRGLFGDGYFDIINALSVFHPWWTGNIPSIFVKQTAPFFLMILPAIVILGFFKNPKKYHNISIFFTLIFLLGVFLTKQSAEPFPQVYAWLYSYFPGFNAFREASKFFLISSLAISSLTAIYVSTEERYSRFQKMLISILVLIIGMNAWSIFSGKIGTMFIPRNFPVSLQKINDVLEKDSSFSRVLWLPHTNRFGDYNNIHPSVSMLTSYDGFFSDLQSGEYDMVKKVQGIIAHKDFINQLQNRSIKYIVVPENLEWDDIYSPWKTPSLYTPILEKQKHIKKLLSFSGSTIYSINTSLPHVVSNSPLSFFQKNNSNFSLEISDISGLSPLIFTNNYSPDWKLFLKPYSEDNCNISKVHSGSLDIKKDLSYSVTECDNKNVFYNGGEISKLWKKPIFDKSHTMIYNYANQWTLDANYIKENYAEEYYKENPDGSIDIKMTLYFKPQSYFYLGLIISGTTLIFVLSYLGYAIVKSRRKKHKK